MTQDRQKLIDIIPVFETTVDVPTTRLYSEIVLQTLEKILPHDILLRREEGSVERSQQRLKYHQLLPMVAATRLGDIPCNLSFYCLSKYRSNSFKFFFEMISRWLVPGKRLNVVLIYATDFELPQISEEIYTLCEVVIRVDSQIELDEIQKNFPIIESEILLGVDSAYFARKILDVRGLSTDEKTAIVQEYMAYLATRRPKDFDQDLFTEMQHIMVMCKDDFKTSRGTRHLGRIISIQYLFRKVLREAIKKAPQKRHVSLKLFKTKIHLSNGTKKVLGVLVGINFIRDKELFEERHLIQSLLHSLPNVRSIEHSFLLNKRGSENLSTLYIEIEKNDGSDFTRAEMYKLRKELPNDIKNRIEQLVPPVFMPRNEEEIMRNILSLSSQIKYVRDIPQVFISFDEQKDSDLFFTVILVRVLKEDSQPIKELFQRSETDLDYLHDQSRQMGFIRKKYPKEATVFRVKLSRDKFLRVDQSIDLYKARQFLVEELSRIIGELRDFNGGMISKQNELLSAVRHLLNDQGKYNELLLENFFYSLTPVMMRTLLEPLAFKTLFVMLMNAIKDISLIQGPVMTVQQDMHDVFIMITSDDKSLKDELQKAVSKLHISQNHLAQAFIKVHDFPCIGFILHSDDIHKREAFCQVLERAIEQWKNKKLPTEIISTRSKRSNEVSNQRQDEDYQDRELDRLKVVELVSDI